MEKREPLHTVGGTVNWCSHHGNQYGDAPPPPKKKKIELPYDYNNSNFGYSFIAKNKNTTLKRYTHPLVHRSTVYKRQDKDTP